MRKRRILSTMLVVSAALLAFTACGKNTTTKNDTSKKITTSATTSKKTTQKVTTKKATTQAVTTKKDDPVIEQFEVVFNTNGGSNINSVNVVKGNKVEKPSNPTKAGYTFGGWFKDASLKTEFDFDLETIISATTIYAKWDADNVTIEFISNAGSEVSGEVSAIDTKYGQIITLPEGTSYESLNYTFSGWTTTNYVFGGDDPTVEYNAGVEINLDDFAVIAEDGKIKFYAVFEKNEYTYKVTKVDSTLTTDGYIEYKCNEDPTKSHTEILKKEDIFYARPIVASSIGDKLDIKVEVMQGEIKDTDKITIGLTGNRIANDIQVVGMSKNGGYVSKATAGEIVNIIVTGDYTATDVCFANGLVCENNKAILNDELYLRVDLLDSSEGGKTAPIYEDYTLALSLYGTQVQDIIVKEIYYTNYVKTTEAHPGQSYLFKVVVPEASTSVFGWRGISGTLKEIDSTSTNIGSCEILGSTVSEFNLVTIQVALNDGTTNSTSFEASSELYISDLPKLYRSGYKFLGYYSDTSYDDIDLLELFNEGETIAYWYTKGIYAIWEEVEGFTISDVEYYVGRGTVVKSTSATPFAIAVDDSVLVYTDNAVIETTIMGIVIGKSRYDSVPAGSENVELLLDGVSKDDVKAGDVLVLKPIA